MSKELEDLKALIDSGNFHHATYRSFGTLWEGLWIYKKSQTGYRGFEVALCFLRANPELPQAEEMVKQFGTSVGSYGKG